MFKTDKDSLEKISFMLDERDLANYRSILEKFRTSKLLNVSEDEYNSVVDGLNEIANLKLNGKIYGFHVDDTWVRRGGNYGEGVELYLRQGNILGPFFTTGSRDSLYSSESAVHFLKENHKSTIYTGNIQSEFLGLPLVCDEDDPVSHTILDGEDIEVFESSGIKVVRLEYLL